MKDSCNTKGDKPFLSVCPPWNRYNFRFQGLFQLHPPYGERVGGRHIEALLEGQITLCAGGHHLLGLGEGILILAALRGEQSDGARYDVGSLDVHLQGYHHIVKIDHLPEPGT